MDQSKLKDSLTRVYQVLKFTSEEVAEAINNLAALQQLAVAAELFKDLSPEEAKSFDSKLSNLSEEQRKNEIMAIIRKRQENEQFKAKMKDAVERVTASHLAYLKTRGDDSQKAQIAQVLAGV